VTDPSNPAIARVIEVASRKGVSLDIRTFDVSTPTAAETAAAVDAEVGQIVRSIVFVAARPEGRLATIVCLVSGANQVDPKLLAAVMGERSVRPATAREARELTGFGAGGMPPIGHGRGTRVVMDQDLCPYQWVWAAAGTDNSVFRVTPGILRMLANATVSPIAAAPWVVAPALPQMPRVLEAGSGA
jgi:prolyl-tRNA editing enzyme YbaK/EbsC (Cys-tRNA(Pro) deacylase)